MEDSYHKEDKAVSIIGLFFSTAALMLAIVAPIKWVTIIFSVIAGLLAALGGLGLLVALGDADTVKIQDELCPHFSANTVTDSKGDVFHFCDDCGEQLSRFDPRD
jgi:hypothetical protein